jgi:hypothetical protein
MTRTRKKVITAYVEPELKERFMLYLKKTYPIWEPGLITNEANKALNYWLNMHTSTQETLNVKPPNPMPRMAAKYSKLRTWLSHTFFYDLSIPGNRILDEHLFQGIVENFGGDPRTVGKWVKNFAIFGLIKRLDYNHWELM